MKVRLKKIWLGRPVGSVITVSRWRGDLLIQHGYAEHVEPDSINTRKQNSKKVELEKPQKPKTRRKRTKS